MNASTKWLILAFIRYKNNFLMSADGPRDSWRYNKKLEEAANVPRVRIHGVPFLRGLLGQISDLDRFSLSFQLVSQMGEEVEISGSGAFRLSGLSVLSFALAVGLCATHI